MVEAEMYGRGYSSRVARYRKYGLQCIEALVDVRGRDHTISLNAPWGHW